jgi:hypothetical protein
MTLTDFLLYLLKSPRSREEAGAECRRMGLRIDWGRYYWEVMR